MIAKINKTFDGRNVLAVCDSDLLGKKFEEKDLQIDLTSNFYKGDKKNKEDVLELFKIASIINLVGKESVELGIRAGIIDKEKVIKIKGVPHAQVLL